MGVGTVNNRAASSLTTVHTRLWLRQRGLRASVATPAAAADASIGKVLDIYGEMVSCILAMDAVGVRFPLDVLFWPLWAQRKVG